MIGINKIPMQWLRRTPQQIGKNPMLVAVSNTIKPRIPVKRTTKIQMNMRVKTTSF